MNVHNHSKDMMQYIVTHEEAAQQSPMNQFVSFSLYSCLSYIMDNEIISR